MGRLTRAAQQRAEIVRQVLRDALGAYDEAQAPLRIVNEALRAMVHRVSAGRGACALRKKNAEFPRRLKGCIGIAVQAEEARIEGGDVLGEHFAGIALWIDGDEKHLNL